MSSSVVEAAHGHLGDGEDALRGIGLGRAGELALVDVREIDPDAGARSRAERRRAGASASCGATRTPRTMSGEREQLLDGAHALGDEELLALASAPSPEVAG